MKNDSLVIMAGGASSRMKRSLSGADLEDKVLSVAKNLHKSLIPLDDEGRPLLYFLLKNALNSGIRTVYLVTSKDNEAFHNFVSQLQQKKAINGLEVKFAIQHVPAGREKPLGTADALQQCLEQHKNLLKEKFSVCNGDNLYGVDAFKMLSEERAPSNALVAYDGLALGHPEEKIAKFALLDFTKDHILTDIIEKPNSQELNGYKKRHDRLWVSMNIFNLEGEIIYPFLVDCPLDPIRNEKELPMAIKMMMERFPQSILCFPCSERIPDLTSATDISSFFK